jgi:hypothetical protein
VSEAVSRAYILRATLLAEMGFSNSEWAWPHLKASRPLVGFQ